MAEYIEREAAFDAVKEVGQKAFDMGEKDMALAVMVACEKVQKLPAADVQPVKHGHIESYPDDGIVKSRCSECGCNLSYTMFSIRDNRDREMLVTSPRFCPNCGAKMDGGYGK